MIELNVIQGSPEWLAARAKCFSASDAPAMMGVSAYKTRSSLLREKATGIVPEIDSATAARFAAGHAAEESARPHAEAVIGEELYPIVATTDDGKYLASSDGATMLVNIGFEHKLWNESIAESVRSGNVPESHKWQLVHQTLVFGFDRIMFVVSDGTVDKFVYCWFSATKEDIDQLLAGWDQFEKDLAGFEPDPVIAKAVAEKVEGLPALFVQVEGRVVASNMDAFKSAAEAFIARLPKADALQTDQDFANADQAAKDCKDAEEKLQVVKAQAQSQAVSIDEAFRAIDTISEKIRAARLSLEKVVKAEKENRKAEIVRDANQALSAHIASLQGRVGILVNVQGNFGECIKGLKSLDSMRDKLSVALANAKIEANAIADRIEANRRTVEDMSLFPDFAQVCTKAPDDFSALMAMRIGQRKAIEEKRLEAERERIRAEEQAKAQREAAEAQRKKQEADRLAAEEAKKLAPIVMQGIEAAESIGSVSIEMADSLRETVASIAADAAIDTAKNMATIKLGEICTRLGYTVSAEFLASLGFKAETEKNAKLYPASQFPTICRKIADHTLALAFKKAA